MRSQTSRTAAVLILPFTVLLALPRGAALRADSMATDPGVRGGPAGAGGPLPGTSPSKLQFFLAGQGAFQEIDSVQGTIPDTGTGLGPRFNLDSCAGCHSQPAAGGTSPLVNPQVAVAHKAGASNFVPSFVTLDAPVRDAFLRFKTDGTRDGRLVNLFTIGGRDDAPGCALAQPDLEGEFAAGNLGFRMPSPMFGDGLVSEIDDSTILANMNANGPRKHDLGISGHPNTIAGSIGRFGWKSAPNSIKLFVAGAYNAEVGVTNPLSPNERDDDPACQFNATPEDHTHPEAPTRPERQADVTNFATFVQFLAAPTPVPDTPSIIQGRQLFDEVGCALCHTPMLRTGSSLIGALRRKRANLYSDLLVHHMGPGLADQIVVVNAGPDEFRTSPLWGLGQRIFLMHDGRTKDLRVAITAHRSAGNAQFVASEANAVIDAWDALSEAQKQDVLNFLRGL